MKPTVKFYIGLALLIAGYFVFGIDENDPETLLISGVFFGMGIVTTVIYGSRLFAKCTTLNPEKTIPRKPIEDKQRKQNTREKIIVISVILILFLPIRLLIYGYISQNSYISVGTVSLVGIALVILSEKNKLGKFGIMWKRHIHELTHGKYAKLYVVATIFTIPFLAIHLVFLDQGSHQFYNDRQLVLASIMTDAKPDFIQTIHHSNVNLPDNTVMAHVKSLSKQERGAIIVSHLRNPLFLMPFFLSIENEESHGWIQHLIVVSLVAECEGVALFILYRRIYRNKITPNAYPIPHWSPDGNDLIDTGYMNENKIDLIGMSD